MSDLVDLTDSQHSTTSSDIKEITNIVNQQSDSNDIIHDNVHSQSPSNDIDNNVHNSDIITHTANTIPIIIQLNNDNGNNNTVHIKKRAKIDHNNDKHDNDNTATDSNYIDNTLHVLPCQIDYNGPANILTYFTPTIKQIQQSYSSDTLYQSRFRGRLMTGKNVKLRNDCIGLVVNDNIKENNKIVSNVAVEKELNNSNSNNNNQQQYKTTWTLNNTFNNIFLWNRDEQINERDYMMHALTDMIDLNNVIQGV